MSQRNIYTIKFANGVQRAYDPLLLRTRIKACLPEIGRIIKDYSDGGDEAHAALRALTDGLSAAFEAQVWAQDNPDGLLAEELIEAWNHWCQWCEVQKKRRGMTPNSPPPTGSSHPQNTRSAADTANMSGSS